jgi:anthranilate synthase component 1
MHIVSNVDGVIRDDVDAVDALLAGLPAGTVSGARGEMDTAIALRTAVLKDGKMYVQAGGGVVWDSDPEAERMETVNKSRAIFRAAEEALRFALGDRRSNR